MRLRAWPRVLTASIAVYHLVSLSAAGEPVLGGEGGFEDDDNSRHWQATGPPVCPPKQLTALTWGLRHTTCPIPLDDLSPVSPTTGSPWSYHPPTCILQSPSRLRRVRKKYCLYTDTTFGPHGLSLLITPEAAAAAQPVISAAYHSLFPDNATVQHFALGSGDRNPAYKVVDMPDKHGKGIVATRRIAKRDTFLVDWAALSGDLELWGSVPMREGKSILDLAALQLPDPEAVTGLSRKGADEDAGVVEGVIAVNTFRTYLDGAPMKTLFPLISRINHACNPNSFIRFAEGGLMAGVAAFRDIEPGEEITVSYISLSDTYSERTKKLQDNWGFTCTCSLCKSPAKVLAASDKRRELLVTGIDDMVSKLQRGDVQGAVATLRAALKALSDEGLDALAADVYEALARIYWVVNQKKEARKLARLAVESRADWGGRLAPVDIEAELREMVRAFDDE